MAEHVPQTVLVTGGAGFIGSHLVRHLLNAWPTSRIVLLDRLTYAGDLNRLEAARAHPRLQIVIGDIGDRALVDGLLADATLNTVLHLAAESHVDRSIVGPDDFIRTNVVGTFTLLEACRHAWLGGPRQALARFHHVSTDEVFGQLGPDDAPFSAETRYAPNSPYAASKAASDHLVRAYAHTYGLPVVLTNCSNNYGPHQHDEKFIPTVIRACLQQQPIPVYGTGRNVRDWLHVQDHCEALALVAQRGRNGATYLIGGENEWTNLHVVQLICAIMDELRPAAAPHADLIQFVTDRAGHDWRYAIDPSALRDELGWRPSWTFEEGLRETVAWAIEAARTD